MADTPHKEEIKAQRKAEQLKALHNNRLTLQRERLASLAELPKTTREDLQTPSPLFNRRTYMRWLNK